MITFGSLFAVRKLGDSDGILLENCADKDQRLATLGIYFEESAMNDLVKYIYENVPEPDHCMKLLNKSRQSVLGLLLAQSSYGSYTDAVIAEIGSVDSILQKFHDDSVVISLDTQDYDVDDAVVDDFVAEEPEEESAGASKVEAEPYKEVEQKDEPEEAPREEQRDEPRDRVVEIHQMVTAIARYLGIDPSSVAGREEIEANAVKEAVGCIFNASSASLKSALLEVFVNANNTGRDISMCANFFALLIQYMNLDEIQ